MKHETIGSRAPARVAAALLAIGVASAIAAAEIPREFRGDWVPAKGDCGSALRFRAAEGTMVLVNGKDSASYGDVAISYSFFGPDYEGISVVVLPEFESGDSPFTVFFNADEAKGVTKIQILQGDEIAGPGREAYNAIVRRAKALNARFPLDNVPLKRCDDGNRRSALTTR